MCFREYFVRWVNERGRVRVIHDKGVAERDVIARRLQARFIEGLDSNRLPFYFFFYVNVG
jgi:hypothetical protein